MISPRFFSPEQNSVVAGEASLEFHNRGKAEGEAGLKQQVRKSACCVIGNCVAERQSHGQSLPPIGWVSPVTLSAILLERSLCGNPLAQYQSPRSNVAAVEIQSVDLKQTYRSQNAM